MSWRIKEAHSAPKRPFGEKYARPRPASVSDSYMIGETVRGGTPAPDTGSITEFRKGRHVEPVQGDRHIYFMPFLSVLCLKKSAIASALGGVVGSPGNRIDFLGKPRRPMRFRDSRRRATPGNSKNRASGNQASPDASGECHFRMRRLVVLMRRTQPREIGFAGSVIQAAATQTSPAASGSCCAAALAPPAPPCRSLRRQKFQRRQKSPPSIPHLRSQRPRARWCKIERYQAPTVTDTLPAAAPQKETAHTVRHSIRAQLLAALAGAIAAALVSWLMIGFGPVRTLKINAD